jgi:integrase
MSRTKSKPAWQNLTWHAARGQWKKYRKGSTYYLGDSGVKRTRKTHDQALAEWKRKEAELIATATDTAEADRRATLRQTPPATYQAAALSRGEIIPEVDVVSGDPTNEIGRLLARAAALSAGVADEPDFAVGIDDQPQAQTIGHAIDAYLNFFRTQVEAGQRTRSRYEPLRVHLEKFRTWTPPTSPAEAGKLNTSSISASLLTAWHAHLIQQMADGEAKASYAHDQLGTIKQFVRWAWENELCDMPRNLGSKSLSIPIPSRKPKHLTTEDIQRILAAATDRTRLLIQLMLNTGATAKDLSDLAPDELDIKAGRITRQRSKTRRHGDNVPTVSYTIWPSTINLLKKYREKSGDRVLLTAKGQPLVRDWIRDDGQVGKVDSVRLAFGRAVKAANKSGAEAEIKATVKMLRATAANMLEQHPDHQAITSLFLAHSPRSIKEKHYVAANQQQLDAAVKWLGEYLELA